MDSVSTKAIGSGLIASGLGLIVWRVHNNKDCMKKRKVQYLDDEPIIRKTLFLEEWFKEV